jgi:hypothetical protein
MRRVLHKLLLRVALAKRSAVVQKRNGDQEVPEDAAHPDHRENPAPRSAIIRRDEINRIVAEHIPEDRLPRVLMTESALRICSYKSVPPLTVVTFLRNQQQALSLRRGWCGTEESTTGRERQSGGNESLNV